MIGIGNPSPKISYVTLKRGLEMDTEEEEMTLLLYRSTKMKEVILIIILLFKVG